MKRRIAIGLILLVVAALAGVVVAYPSMAAATCPGCYGLVELQPGVYVEDGLSEAQRQQVRTAAEEGNERVARFYGGRESSPRLLVCLTEECYSRIGGGKEKGVAVLNRAVMLSPRGVDAVIASHELSHAELHARLASGAEVPQWFDEGLAVVVSDDPRYLGQDRCTAGPLPVTLEEWLRAASADQQIYAQAGCRVSRWIGASGPDATLNLIRRLNSGESFTSIVRP